MDKMYHKVTLNIASMFVTMSLNKDNADTLSRIAATASGSSMIGHRLLHVP